MRGIGSAACGGGERGRGGFDEEIFSTGADDAGGAADFGFSQYGDDGGAAYDELSPRDFAAAGNFIGARFASCGGWGEGARGGSGDCAAKARDGEGICVFEFRG